MAEIAEAVQRATPHQPMGSLKIGGPISKFSEVLDTVRSLLLILWRALLIFRQNTLVTAYLDLADSLHKTRGGLRRDNEN